MRIDKMDNIWVYDNPTPLTFHNETFSPRMMSVPSLSCLMSVFHCFEKGVKIGFGGGCPGVTGAEHESISMASRWRAFWSKIHSVLCNLTQVLMISDAGDVIQSVIAETLPGTAKVSQAITDLCESGNHLATESVRQWSFHDLLLAGPESRKRRAPSQ
ncbi:unnamed protein product, partial [Strongylus vulgaris]